MRPKEIDKIEYPATNDDAEIILTAEDGIVSPPISVDAVCPVFVAGKNITPEFNGGMALVRGLDWSICFTDKRIIFWSPYSIGAWGRTTEVADKAIGGHFVYERIRRIVLANDESPYTLIISSAMSGAGETECHIEAPTKVLFELTQLLSEKLIDCYKQKQDCNPTILNHFEEVGRFDWNGGKGQVHLELIASGRYSLADQSRLSAVGNPTMVSYSVPPIQNTAQSVSAQDIISAKPIETRFCENCGFEITHIQATSNYCPMCGKEI